MRRLFILGWIVLGILVQFIPRPAQASDEYIMVVQADAAVVPVLEDYLDRALTQAEEENAALVIVELDTPGGSVAVMNDIIERIRGADVPVAVYVAPTGSMAASAGALITLAGHVSVMAPNTVIGASSPIMGDGSDLNETAEQKAEEILTATMRGLVENRPEEAQQVAEEMITDARAVSASEALEIGLIDYIVSDREELVSVLEGRTVTLDTGEEITLSGLGELGFLNVEMTFIEQLLLILTDPAIVFLLLSTGVLLVIIELRAPGGWVAGTLGATSIALSLYGIGVLPVNLLGFVFFGIAIVLFLMEIAIPETFGALTAVAAVSLAAGGLIMFNNEEIDQFGGVPWYLIIGQSVAVGVLGLLFFAYIMRTLQGGSMTGETGMLGMLGEVRIPLEPQGMVFVNGERWKAQAQGSGRIDVGETVRVVKMEDLLLTVEPVDPAEFGGKKPPRPGR
jgi:membrane-bound serine protease (ClpP class)